LLAESAGGGVVLDVGAGPGDLARPLAELVERVDAVDLAPGMVEEGRRREGGDRANLRWIVGAVEEVELDPPYDLIVAGESIHWFDWQVVMPRLRQALAPGALVAIVVRDWFADSQIRRGLVPLYEKFSTVEGYVPVNAVDELEARGLFRRVREAAADAPWQPTIYDLIGCHHSQNGFSPGEMGPEALAAFDRELTEAFANFATTGLVEKAGDRYHLKVRAKLLWGEIPEP
jgi:SAM-dependent methyltransferase